MRARLLVASSNDISDGKWEIHKGFMKEKPIIISRGRCIVRRGHLETNTASHCLVV